MKVSFSKCAVSILLMVGAVLLVASYGKKTSLNAKVEPAGAEREFIHREDNSGTTNFVTVDSSTNGGLLLMQRHFESKVIAAKEFPSGDLWWGAVGANGRRRFIASNVIHARFSPDGKKIAYSTRQEELFIETLNGERFARIARAFDPSWKSPNAVAFCASVGPEYPELTQAVIYDLETGRMTPMGRGN